MYPVVPVSPIDTAALGSLVKTGFPVAGTLLLASALILMGLFALRAAAVVDERTGVGS